MINFRYIPKDERDALKDDQFGFVDGERRLFPIVIESDVADAARLIGKAKGLTDEQREAVKAKIIKIAKDKGFKLPKSWQADMSDLEGQLVTYINFNMNDTFNIEVDNQIVTLQVIEIQDVT